MITKTLLHCNALTLVRIACGTGFRLVHGVARRRPQGSRYGNDDGDGSRAGGCYGRHRRNVQARLNLPRVVVRWGLRWERVGSWVVPV